MGPLAGRWTGKAGILTALATAGVFAMLVRGTWTMRKAPNDGSFAEKRVTAL